MKWRRTLRVLHRDIGYAAAALVIAYAVSGIAVNHLDDWNPNYSIEEHRVDVGPLPTVGDHLLDAREAHLVEALGLDRDAVRGRLDSGTEFQIFLRDDGSDVTVDAATGQGVWTVIEKRPFLFEVNALHLNNIKGVWTWVADIFSLALLFLAVSGILMLRRQEGIAGRGKWFVGAGLLVPVGFILYMYYGA